MKNIITLTAVALLLLGACAKQIEPLVISTKPIDKPPLVLPKADVIKTRDVNWVIITPENFEKIFAELSKNGDPIVMFALTADGYEALSLNQNDIRTYIQQQQAILYAYSAYYQRGL